MQPLESGRLLIEVVSQDSTMRVIWSGVSDEREPSAFLDPYLDGVLDAARGGPVEVNFSGMEYLNSATVPCLLRFVRGLNSRGVETELVYDGSQTYQRTAFAAFRALAAVLPHLSVRSTG